MKTIHSNKYYTVHSLNKSDSNCTFFFVPGGPGISAKCFVPFAKKFLPDFNIVGITFSGLRSYSLDLWSKDLEHAIAKFSNCIVIAHSFGGMVILNSTKLNQLAKGLVLLNTSPNLEWRKNFSKIKLSKLESKSIQKNELIYTKSETEKNLKKMWSSWAPFYFSKKNKLAGSEWLNTLNYIVPAYQGMDLLLSKYSAKLKPTIPCLVMSGSRDKITPVNSFIWHKECKNYRLIKHTIPSSGHFPWVDNPNFLAQKLLEFINEIEEAP